MITRKSIKAGMPPGTLIHIGQIRTEEPEISIISFNEDNYYEKNNIPLEECFNSKNEHTVNWININGIHDINLIEYLGKTFNIHNLVLEDILNTSQRPKIEDFNDYIFIALKMIKYNEDKKSSEIEHISILLFNNYILSLQEQPGDVFDPIRTRIKNNKGRIRKMGPDYLTYALLDCIIDNYFIIIEKISDQLEELQDILISNPHPEILHSIHRLKKDIIVLRRSIWPLREIISNIERDESKLIKKSTNIYFRDIYDHTIQVMDTIETSRDILSSMLDIYLSSISNRMNEIMKVLTIIATIFIPLTFIAGVYGMNFENMPELDWNYGYFIILVFMLTIFISMLLFFKKKKWI